MNTLLLKMAIGGYLAFGVLAGLFIIGESFDDPGGRQAIWMMISWLIPLVIGVIVAVRNPPIATFVFIGLTAGIVVSAISQLIAKTQWRSWESENGPILAIATLVVCISLAVWARKNPMLAGSLMLVCGFTPLLTEVIEMGRLHLGGSTGAMSAPTIVAGALMVLSQSGAKTQS